MLAVKGAKILTVTKGIIENGTALVEDGKFKTVGCDVPVPAGTEVFDATGKYMVPGFIDCHSHVGIIPLTLDREYGDVNEATNAITGECRAIDGVYFDDVGFRDGIEEGVTAMLIHPGSQNNIGGVSVALKAAGTRESRVIRNPAGLKGAWTASRRLSPARDIPYVAGRMAVTSLFRNWFKDAKDYMAKLEAGEKNPERNPRRRDIYEAFAKVLRREMPLRVHSMLPQDFRALFTLQDEFGFDLSVEHGDEAWVLASEFARRNVCVAYGPLMGDAFIPVYPNSRPDGPKILDDAGVLLGFQTDSPYVHQGFLRFQAIIAVKHGGLAPERALRALTINAAKMMGAESRLGSIEAGKDADFSIFTGDPLHSRSKAEAVFIDGKRVN